MDAITSCLVALFIWKFEQAAYFGQDGEAALELPPGEQLKNLNRSFGSKVGGKSVGIAEDAN